MLLESEAGIWAQADARVFALLMEPNRTERRLLAANRTITAAVARVAALRRWMVATAERENMRAARAVEREMRELGRAWGRPLRVRAPRQSKRPARANTKRALLAETPHARRPRAYQKPLRDSRGRIAIFFRVRYVGLKSKNWRPGLSADHVIYILREIALEEPGGELITNMGARVEEIAAGWRAIEEVEQGYRANAKVQFRIILNLPHQLSPEQRRDLVKDYCERTFGRLGLPYVAAIHKPDEDGDQRNYHAHICFSTRPVVRVGDQEWVIAQEKVNGLDDKEGLMRLRALAAAHINLACRDAGLALRVTHLSYKARGMDAERQEHVGPAAMAAFRKGEDVAAVQRNEAVVESNETAVACQHAAAELKAAERLAELLGRRVQLDELRARATARLRRLIPLRRLAEDLAARTPPSPARTGTRLASVGSLARAARERIGTASLPEPGERIAAIRSLKNKLEAALRPPSPGLRAGGADAIARARRLAHAARVARRSAAAPRAGSAARLRTTAAVARAASADVIASAIKLARHRRAHHEFGLALERIESTVATHRITHAEEERREAQTRRDAERARDEGARRRAAEQAEAAHQVLRRAGTLPVRPPAQGTHQGRQHAAAAENRTDLGQSIQNLRQLDPWVISPAEGDQRAVGAHALAFLRQDQRWMEGAAVQRALLDIALEQQEAIDSIVQRLCWRDERLALEKADSALQRRVDAWSSEPDFIDYVEGLRPELREQRERVEQEAARAAPQHHPSKADETTPFTNVPPWVRGQDPGLGG